MTNPQEFMEATFNSTNAGALIPKVIDQNLLDYARKYDPFDAAIATITWNTLTYFFNQADQFPTPQATLEVQPSSGAGSVAASASNYAQRQFSIKHYQSRGDLGAIAVQVSTVSVGNLMLKELQRHAQAMRWFRSLQHIYGDATATNASNQPMWDGLFTQMATGQQIQPMGGFATTLQLGDLDNLIDLVEIGTATPLPEDEFFFTMSPAMRSEIGRLNQTYSKVEQTAVLKARSDNGVLNGPIVEAQSGLEVPAHRGIPIVKTSMMTNRGAMGTVTAAATGADGAMGSTNIRFYAVDVITQHGPSFAAQASVTPAAATNHVDLTFATPVINDALGKPSKNYLYRIYAGPSATTMSLYAVVNALDASDSPVTTIRDLGGSVLANPGANQVAGALYGSNPAGGVNGVGGASGTTGLAPVLATNAFVENILLVSRFPDYLTLPTLNDLRTVMLAQTNPSSMQFAVTGDAALAMRAPLFAGALIGAKTR